MKRSTWFTLSLSVAAVLAAGFLAPPYIGSTQSPAVGLPSESSANPGIAPGEAALRATINPETGNVEVSSSLPPGKTLDAHTLQALRRDTEDLKQVFHPGGAVSVHLQGRFQSTSVARIDKNGTRVICTENADDVLDMLVGRTAAKPIQDQTPEVR